jgi:hypothetical protein
MKTKSTMRVAATLICITAALAEPARPAIPTDRISVFQVPLVCPAAPQIGCGSRTKPILLELEKQGPVAEAWLNRQGTLLAVVWQPNSKRKARKAAVSLIMKKEELEARELAGAERKNALADFPSQKEWLRGSDVDRLSEEEATILAGRVIRKIKSLIELNDPTAKTLQEQISAVFKLRLTGQLPESSSPREEILKILRTSLSDKDLTLLQQALKDYRPGQDIP